VIVVGVDGSAGAARALDVAAREAALRSTDLRVVCAWHVPVGAYAGGMIAPAIDADDFASPLRTAAQRQIDEILERVDVPTELVLREGNAAATLLDEAQRAEMVVVGSRGRGGFTGLLLGSVSHQVASHASCPVLVVPESAARHEP
jgi:nucleotide-binding universal stress UspA family protein